jgi:hypothetical protein
MTTPGTTVIARLTQPIGSKPGETWLQVDAPEAPMA